MEKRIVIIGNGISGITCARELRKKSNASITIISAETKHFFSRTALMYVYMGHMKYEHTKPYEDWFWKKNRLELIHDKVVRIDTKGKILLLEKSDPIIYDQLVIASGSISKMPDWPGKNLLGVQGFYSFQDLELMEKSTKNIQQAVIVGGGLIGIEMAEMLCSRGISVTMLVKDKYFWNNILPDEEAQLVGRHIAEHHVKLLTETELESIHDENDGKVNFIKTKDGKRIDCEFVGLTVGVKANMDFIEGSGIDIDKGILVNEFLETNIADVFAIGDCVQYQSPPEGRKNIEQVWYTGRMHGETLAKTLAGNHTKYQPGPWFNSAKFFDIEYQTYGNVPAIINENQQTFYWENTKNKIAFRATFNKSNKKLIGVNAFGLRLRHHLFDKWLREEKDVEHVLMHFEDANFDQELAKNYSKAIIEAYNHQFNTNIPLKQKSWKRILGLASK